MWQDLCGKLFHISYLQCALNEPLEPWRVQELMHRSKWELQTEGSQNYYGAGLVGLWETVVQIKYITGKLLSFLLRLAGRD